MIQVAEAMHREAFDLLCADLIGYGMSRKVFTSRILPDCVVKVEQDGGQFQNVIEWETWNRVRNTDASRWFAECKWISPNGSVLIMERTRTPSLGEFPEKMPIYLCDFKRSNYGMVRSTRPNGAAGRDWFVCHDYGTNLLFENGMSKRMHKADWSNGY